MQLAIGLAIALLVSYFVLILPQQLAQRSQRKELARLSVGDEVVTIGGLVGRLVADEGGDVVELEIAEGVRVRVVRRAISHRRCQ